jgi:hypothetical protein
LRTIRRKRSPARHRPWTNDPAFTSLTAADASTEYRQILEPVIGYLHEMEVPQSIIDLIVTTSSGDMRWVDASDSGLERPPSIAEWEDASRAELWNFPIGNKFHLRSTVVLHPKENKEGAQCGFALVRYYRTIFYTQTLRNSYPRQ